MNAVNIGFGFWGDGAARVTGPILKQIAEPKPSHSGRAASIVSTALAIIGANAFASSNVDMKAMEIESLQSLPRQATARDAYAVVYRAVLGLHDHHSTLDVMEDRYDLGHKEPNKAPFSAVVRGGIGYLTLDSFGSSSQALVDATALSLHEQLAAISSSVTRGWIFDLRNFAGGGNWAYTAALCPFFKAESLGAFVNSSDETFEWWCDNKSAGTRHGKESATLARIDSRNGIEPIQNTALPLVVIIGPRTASAGEVLTAQFIDAPTTLLIGQPTAGLTTGVQPFPLTDVATLYIASGTLRDRKGIAVKGKITPPMVVEPADSFSIAEGWISKEVSLRDRQTEGRSASTP